MSDLPTMKHVRERGDNHDYSDLVLPLDYMILEFMPRAGTTFSGLYPIGSTVKDITKKLSGAVPPTIISARVRLMNELGLCLKIKALGATTHGAAWQRTDKADPLLKEWKEEQGAS